jgi:hypothetical protein
LGRLSDKTEHIKSWGRSVVWNKKLVIPIEQIGENDEMEIRVGVYEENTFSDKLVGEAVVDLLEEYSAMLMPRHRNKWENVVLKCGEN